MFGWGSKSAASAAPHYADMETPVSDEDLLRIAKKGYENTLSILKDSPWTTAGSVKDSKIFKVAVPGSEISMSYASVECDFSAQDAYDYLAFNQGEPKSESTASAWELLKSVDQSLSVIYSAFAAPFPVSTREFTFVRYLVDSAEHKALVGVGINHSRPVEPGRVRGKLSIGSWIIEPIESSKCKITRLLHTDPKGSIPAFLVNYTVNKTGEQVVNLRAAAEAWIAAGKPLEEWKSK